jgi:uncharacterized protein
MDKLNNRLISGRIKDSILTDSSSRFNPGSSGILAAGRFLTLRALLWGALLCAINVGFLFASVFGASWLGLRGDWAYLPPIALPMLACYLYVLLVRRFERRRPVELQIGRTFFFELPVGFIFGGAFIAAMWALLWSLRLYSTHRGVWTRWFDDLVFDSYISAVLEELAFRAVLLRVFARAWGAKTAILLSSLIFGLAHFSHGSTLGVLGIILNGGITMGLLYMITGRLWMSIGMHLGYDFIETSVLGINSNHGLLINTARPGMAAWLTGGSFGPDAAAPAILLGLVINAFLWRHAFKRRDVG